MNISRLMRRNLQITLKRVTGMTALLLLLQACSTDKETALVFAPDQTDRLGTPTTPNNQPPVGVDPTDPSFWILNGGVEDGVEPWYPRGARIEQSSAEKRVGMYSLLVTERTEGWNGPAMDLPYNLPAGSYRASAWVRLVDGEEPAQINLTLQTGPADFNPFTRSTVTDSDWVQISGTFTHNPAAPMETFLVYIESDSETASFYVDELTLTAVDAVQPAPGPSEWIINGGIEGADESPWRGAPESVVVQKVAEEAHTGDNSLFVSNRSDGWHGAAMDLPKNLPTNRQYHVSVWVKLATGTDETPVSLTLKKKIGEEEYFIGIGDPISATDSAWVELAGTFIHDSFDGALNEFYLYIESDQASATYFVDDLVMTYADELIINGDLETDTTGWWAFGEVTITHSNADAASGDYSLLVTDRTATWQGASFTFEALLANHQYEFSCWVKMAPGQDPSSLMLSLKTIDAEDTEGYPTVDSKSVTNSAWVQLSGSYSPADDITVDLGYVHSNQATASYYIDNCSVVEIEQPESISTLSEGRL